MGILKKRMHKSFINNIDFSIFLFPICFPISLPRQFGYGCVWMTFGPSNIENTALSFIVACDTVTCLRGLLQFFEWLFCVSCHCLIFTTNYYHWMFRLFCNKFEKSSSVIMFFPNFPLLPKVIKGSWVCSCGFLLTFRPAKLFNICCTWTVTQAIYQSWTGQIKDGFILFSLFSLSNT